MKYVFYVFWMFVVILGVTFSGLNSRAVTVNYYINETTLSLPLLLIIVLIIGTVLGCIAMLPSLICSKRASYRLKQQIKQIEQEVNNLRTMPIKETH